MVPRALEALDALFGAEAHAVPADDPAWGILRTIVPPFDEVPSSTSNALQSGPNGTVNRRPWPAPPSEPAVPEAVWWLGRLEILTYVAKNIHRFRCVPMDSGIQELIEQLLRVTQPLYAVTVGAVSGDQPATTGRKRGRYDCIRDVAEKSVVEALGNLMVHLAGSDTAALQVTASQGSLRGPRARESPTRVSSHAVVQVSVFANLAHPHLVSSELWLRACLGVLLKTSVAVFKAILPIVTTAAIHEWTCERLRKRVLCLLSRAWPRLPPAAQVAIPVPVFRPLVGHRSLSPDVLTIT